MIRKREQEKGTTLIEMMIAAVIVVVVAAAGYTFSTNTAKFQARQERIKDMQIRLQSAMAMLVKDIQHAGYGILDPMSESREPFSAANGKGLTIPITSANSTTTPDTLTVLRVGHPIGVLNAEAPSGTNIISVNLHEDFVSTYGKNQNAITGITLVTLGGLFTSTITGVGDINKSTAIFTMGDSLQGKQTFSIGTPVEGLPGRAIVYGITVDGTATGTGATAFLPHDLRKNGVLMATGEVLAPGIEDLQVAYLLDTPDLAGNWVVHNLPTKSFSAVSVSLMAYVPDTDANWTGGQRPALGDRPAGAARDNFHRATLTRVVMMPNL